MLYDTLIIQSPSVAYALWHTHYPVTFCSICSMTLFIQSPSLAYALWHTRYLEYKQLIILSSFSIRNKTSFYQFCQYEECVFTNHKTLLLLSYFPYGCCEVPLEKAWGSPRLLVPSGHHCMRILSAQRSAYRTNFHSCITDKSLAIETTETCQQELEIFL